MPLDLESSIAFLEETNSTTTAYFSFTADQAGEYGIIKANKEGLRLYAAEMLKKSLELEQRQDGEPLFFGHLEWVVSDVGYDLIAGIQPQYQSRGEILASRTEEQPETREPENSPGEKQPSPRKGCLSSLMWVIGGVILLVALAAFTTLHLWGNIH
ncbi:MAG TPA: hypothetical protein VNS58_23785 [Puia sp.]|jgi:hypothetical protein|nr:hypothetical protein [Puia sp.]